jgi:hypothetical protein
MTRMAEDPRTAVIEEFRAAILQGEHAPSQQLIETDLCERWFANMGVGAFEGSVPAPSPAERLARKPTWICS